MGNGEVPTLGKFFGFLLILAGLFLLIIGASLLVEIPGLSEAPEFKSVAGYLSSVGTINMFLYGLLSIGLGIGLLRGEEWAAGGTFVLLLIVIVNLASYVYYAVYTLGIPYQSISILSSIAVIIISIIILLYLVKASGWR